MYNICIDKKEFDVTDLYEMNTILKKKTIEKTVYHKELSIEIREFYYNIFLKLEKSEKIKFLINYQLLIDNAYEYLKNGTGKFEKYFEKFNIKKSEIDKIYKKLISNETIKEKICFNPNEIIKKINSSNDSLNFFYYLSFTVFFLEKYLLNQIVIFPKIFKPKNYTNKSTLELHNYLIKIFSDDFSNSFQIFEQELSLNI